MIMDKVLLNIFGFGMFLIFIISVFVGLFCGKKINFFKVFKNVINESFLVMGILMGVGMFI